MPEETLLAFADHGDVASVMQARLDLPDPALMARFKAAGVDLTDLARRLQEAGVESFAAAWKSLLARIEQTAGAAVAR
jgi:transaldolase